MVSPVDLHAGVRLNPVARDAFSEEWLKEKGWTKGDRRAWASLLKEGPKLILSDEAEAVGGAIASMVVAPGGAIASMVVAPPKLATIKPPPAPPRRRAAGRGRAPPPQEGLGNNYILPVLNVAAVLFDSAETSFV